MSHSVTHDGLYLGLMSGTSIDGIDVALVEFNGLDCRLVASLDYPIDISVKNKLANISQAKTATSTSFENRIERMAEMDVIMGHLFADACNALLDQTSTPASKINAIGSHGQTIRHRASNTTPFTLQIGDANIIAEKTGITTVADFRRMDIAAGGQGAPLAPAFHNAVLRSDCEDRIILNLGGIANITFLPKTSSAAVIGFDTGTANTLLDAWYLRQHPTSKTRFDRDGLFAKKGAIHETLLQELLSDPYFQLPFPKSTGREYFSLEWLLSKIGKTAINAEDVQRTLIELTTYSISDAIKSLPLSNFQVIACGGGMHNQLLLQSLGNKLEMKIKTTDQLGVNGDFLEAMTFAWLAKQRLEKKPGNLPSVTGATKEKILGSVVLPS